MMLYIWPMLNLVPIIILSLVTLSPPILYAPISARKTTSPSGKILSRNRTIPFTLKFLGTMKPASMPAKSPLVGMIGYTPCLRVSTIFLVSPSFIDRIMVATRSSPSTTDSGSDIRCLPSSRGCTVCLMNWPFCLQVAFPFSLARMNKRVSNALGLRLLTFRLFLLHLHHASQLVLPPFALALLRLLSRSALHLLVALASLAVSSSRGLVSHRHFGRSRLADGLVHLSRARKVHRHLGGKFV